MATLPSAPSAARRRLTWVLWAGGAAFTLAFALIHTIGVRTVVSTSMAPELEPGDRVVVNKLVGRVLPVRRGDVIVFRDPGGWAATSATLRGEGAPVGSSIVKRVIGVEGDRVACCAAGNRLTVDGRVLDEPYVPPETLRRQQAFSVVVPPGKLWVMGDNRAASFDSRALVDTADGGFVPVGRVVGRVVAGG